MSPSDLMEIPGKYNKGLALYLSEISSYPINSNSTFLILIGLIVFVIAMTPILNKYLDATDERKPKIKALILSLSFFIPLLCAGIQIHNTIQDLKTSDIIIAKLYANSPDKECEEFSESLEQAISKELKPLTSFYFGWMHKRYEKSIPKNFIETFDKPILVVGGYCSRSISHFHVAIEVKILKISFEPSLPAIISGTPLPYSKDKFESYQLHSEAANAISNSLKLISALSLGCESECYETIKSYKELIKEVEKRDENSRLRERLFENLSSIYTSTKRYDEAENLLATGISEFPESSVLALNLGNTYLIQSKLTLAEPIFLKLSTIQGMHELASQKLQLVQSMKSEKENIDKKTISPKDFNYELRFAEATAASKDVSTREDKEKYHKMAIAKQYGVFNKLAISKLKDGKFQESIIDLDKAIALDPHSAEAYMYKSYALLETNEYKEALTNVDKALVIKPKLKQARLLKAVSLSKLNYASDAVLQAFAMAEVDNENDANVYYQRALHQSSKSNNSAAEQDLNRALKIDPKFPSALLLLADIYIQNKKFLEAKEILKKMQTYDYSKAYVEKINAMKEKISLEELKEFNKKKKSIK